MITWNSLALITITTSIFQAIYWNVLSLISWTELRNDKKKGSCTVFEKDCTYRHLHLEVILVELEEDVRDCTLQEGGGPQNQNQLEVCWEGALKWESTWRHLHKKADMALFCPESSTSHLSRNCSIISVLSVLIIPSNCMFLCIPCENSVPNTFTHVDEVCIEQENGET